MNQLALTSSRLELGEEENLVVHFPACTAVLCSLPGIVGLPALRAPVENSVTFFIVLFCFIYRVTYWFIPFYFLHLYCGLLGTCYCEDLQPDERRVPAGLFFSPLYRHLFCCWLP